jgi:hypothetical protein
LTGPLVAEAAAVGESVATVVDVAVAAVPIGVAVPAVQIGVAVAAVPIGVAVPVVPIGVAVATVLVDVAVAEPVATGRVDTRVEVAVALGVLVDATRVAVAVTPVGDGDAVAGVSVTVAVESAAWVWNARPGAATRRRTKRAGISRRARERKENLQSPERRAMALALHILVDAGYVCAQLLNV